jgi:hypothetical protein
MEKSSQIAWKIVPLRHFFPLKVVPLIEILLYIQMYNYVRLMRGLEVSKDRSYCPSGYGVSEISNASHSHSLGKNGDDDDNFTLCGKPGVTHETVPLNSIFLPTLKESMLRIHPSPLTLFSPAMTPTVPWSVGLLRRGGTAASRNRVKNANPPVFFRGSVVREHVRVVACCYMLA